MRLLRPFLDWSSQLPPPYTTRLRGLRELAYGERVSLSSFQAWLDHASDVLREPNVGLRALSHLARGDGDIVEVGCESAETLGEALNFLVGHARILNQAADFQLWIDGQFASLELRSRAKLSRSMSRAVQMPGPIWRAARALLRGQLPMRAITAERQCCFARR